MAVRTESIPRCVQQCCVERGQDTKFTDGSCPICKPLPERKRPEEPRDFRHMLSLVHETISDVKLQRSASKAKLARKRSKGHLPTSRSVDSLKLPPLPPNMPDGNHFALFPRSDSQLPPMKYQISRSPGERAKLVLMDEVSGQGTRPLYKEVSRGRGILKGHRQERSDILPLRHFENPRPSPANYENPRAAPDIPRQRSMVAQQVNTRFREEFNAQPEELLQPTAYAPNLQPASQGPVQSISLAGPSQRLGPRIMARKNSREDVPQAVRKPSREDMPEPLKIAPRPQLTPVPEVRDESIMDRGRPISRRDSQRGRNENTITDTLSPRSKSAAPTYTLPQTRYSPSEPSIPKLPTHTSPRTPQPTRKDSLDPTSKFYPNNTNTTRILLALRTIDKTCTTLLDNYETLHLERQHLQDEMSALLHKKDIDLGCLEVLRQQQKDLVELDERIDDVVRQVGERQRRKIGLVDGLPEIVEMDRGEEEEEQAEMGVDVTETEAATCAFPPPPPAAISWAPRGDSLTVRASQMNGLLTPPLPLRSQQRGTVTYAEIMDFLDEFD